MIAIVAIVVAIIFAVGIYMLLGRELKGMAMGVFLLAHAAHLSILAMSGSPIFEVDGERQIKSPPVIEAGAVDAQAYALATTADPLPQALILTAIVIGFGIMGFLLSLIVVTGKVTGTLDTQELTEQAEAERVAGPESEEAELAGVTRV